MDKPGYYAAYKDLVLTSQGRRARVQKRDWLVTDGANIGRFDKAQALDWVPLEWGNGQPVLLDDELSAQLHNAVVPTGFSRLESAFTSQLDMGDGSPVPDLPRPSVRALEVYLKARRNLAASFTYKRG